MAAPAGSRGTPGGTRLPERYARILSLVVRAYIEGGEPVSSLWLAEYGNLGVSSATLRSALMRLEELALRRAA